MGNWTSEKGFLEEFVNTDYKSELLEKNPVAKGLVRGELHALAGYFEAWRVESGTYICREGDPGDFICLICQGRVDIIRKDSSGNVKKIASLGPGNTIGEMALIDHQPRSAGIVAHTPVLMLVLNQESYDRLAENEPRLWGKFVVHLARIISKRLRLTSGILAEYLNE